jgi:MoxR-like ATPase
MVDYAVDLVRATRPKEETSPDFVRNWLAWGAGPRAAQNITLGAKARAILHGRFAVTAEDIRHIAYPVLRHRLFTNFNADAEGVDVEQVIKQILETIPEPSYGEAIPSKARPSKSRSGEGKSASEKQPAAPAAAAGPRVSAPSVSAAPPRVVAPPRGSAPPT